MLMFFHFFVNSLSDDGTLEGLLPGELLHVCFSVITSVYSVIQPLYCFRDRVQSMVLRKLIALLVVSWEGMLHHYS
jgi:hypothetical protein